MFTSIMINELLSMQWQTICIDDDIVSFNISIIRANDPMNYSFMQKIALLRSTPIEYCDVIVSYSYAIFI